MTPRLTPAQEAEIVRLYQDDSDGPPLSVRAVADKTGATPEQVRRVVMQAGICRPAGRPRDRLDPAAAATIASALAGGLSMRQAAARYGISMRVVTRIAAQARMVQALRWAWDGRYQIGYTADGALEAWRADGSGVVRAGSPHELRTLLLEDYARKPVTGP